MKLLLLGCMCILLTGVKSNPLNEAHHAKSDIKFNEEMFFEKLCSKGDDVKLDALLDKMFKCEEKLFPDMAKVSKQCYVEVFKGGAHDGPKASRIAICAHQDKEDEFDECEERQEKEHGHTVVPDTQYWNAMKVCWCN